MSKQPLAVSQLPHSPPNPHKRLVSPPPMSYTPATLLTTPPMPTEAPCSPLVPFSRHAYPSPPQLSPRRAVSLFPPPPTATDVSELPLAPALRPPALVEPLSSPVPLCSTPQAVPARLDWAEDTASMPAPPAMYQPPRDLSTLRTDRVQPFGTLRRRTRQRRTPPFFLQRRKFFYSVPPPQPQAFITRRHPSGIGPGRPVIIVPSGVAPDPPAPPALKLDWDQDPRLTDLSHALRALGWTPPG